MLNVSKFADVTENFAFLIKTLYVSDNNIAAIELVGIKKINKLYILMPPGLNLSEVRGEHARVNVLKLENSTSSEYSKYKSHLKKYNAAGPGVFKLGFKHENILVFDGLMLGIKDEAPAVSNGLAVYTDFKSLCEDMTFLNRELDMFFLSIYSQISNYIHKMSNIEFIRCDLTSILERLDRYSNLYEKYTLLYEKIMRAAGADDSPISGDCDAVTENIMYIKDLRENLLVSTDILLCEIENNRSNIHQVSLKLKELF